MDNSLRHKAKLMRTKTEWEGLVETKLFLISRLLGPVCIMGGKVREH